MKKRYILVALVGVAVVSGCSEDAMEANRLSGEYEGTFGMYYEYTRGGRVYQFDAAYTYLQLNNYAFSSKGTGVQIDYYDRGPYTEIWHDIKWKVNHDASGRQFITFHYLWEREWDTNIYDYKITPHAFYGYFDNSTERFYLTNLNPPAGFSWEPYYERDYGWRYNNGWSDGRYGYDEYGYRYAPARRDTLRPGEITFGNRFQEK